MTAVKYPTWFLSNSVILEYEKKTISNAFLKLCISLLNYLVFMNSINCHIWYLNEDTI